MGVASALIPNLHGPSRSPATFSLANQRVEVRIVRARLGDGDKSQTEPSKCAELHTSLLRRPQVDLG
jgi:hypothetical protein